MDVRITVLKYFVYFLAELVNSNKVYCTAKNFLHLSTQALYVDKTGLLIDFFCKNHDYAIYLAAPRRFGKTVNNEMIKYFFDIAFEDDDYTLITNKTKHPYYDHFTVTLKNTKVAKNDNFFNAHFGNYIVFFVELCNVPIDIPEEKIKETIIDIITTGTFLKHEEWWFRSGVEEKICQRVSNSAQTGTCCGLLRSIFNHENIEMQYWIKALQCLFENLHLHYNRKVILIVDEFDFPVLQSLRKLSAVLADNILTFLSHIFGGLTKSVGTQTIRGPDPIVKAYFTGITHLPIGVGSSRMNNVEVYNYFEKNPFNEYYGFGQDEVDNLLAYYNLTEKREDVKNYYDGYHITDTLLRNYNPLSVVEFFKHEGKVQGYWRETASISAWFRVCRDSQILENIQLLGQGRAADLNIPTSAKLDDFKMMKEVFDLCDCVANISPTEYHRQYFFKYLLQEGYLTPASSSTDSINTLYKAPNEEIRREFQQIYLKFAEDVKVQTKLIGEIFWNLADTCSVKKTQVDDLGENFRRLVQSGIKNVDDFVYNGQALRSMIYFPCAQRSLKSNRKDFVYVEVQTQLGHYTELILPNGTIVQNGQFKLGNYGRVDIYFKLHGGKTIMIIETKATSNIIKALAQLLYYRPREDDEKSCEKLILVGLAVPLLPSRKRSTDLERMFDKKLEVLLECYFIENYNYSNPTNPRKCFGSSTDTTSHTTIHGENTNPLAAKSPSTGTTVLDTVNIISADQPSKESDERKGEPLESQVDS